MLTKASEKGKTEATTTNEKKKIFSLHSFSHSVFSLAIFLSETNLIYK